MSPLRRVLLVCVTAAGLGAAGTAARGATPFERQRSPTAHCRDGTYYYGAKNKRLACAHHRGVAEWLAASNRPAGIARGRPNAEGRHRALPGRHLLLRPRPGSSVRRDTGASPGGWAPDERGPHPLIACSTTRSSPSPSVARSS